MINQEIEKEVQQDNKVIAGMNIRQVVCLGIAGVLCIAISLFLDVGFEISMYPCMVLGYGAYLFGWKKKDGMHYEQILLKKLQQAFYKSNERYYRTKNKYIELMNHEYVRRRNMDMKDKETAKAIKKQRKQKKRKSSIKPIL